MRKNLFFGVLLTIIFMLGGCAQSYYPVNATRLSYSASSDFEDINLQYRYDIMNEKGNSKLAKKEKRHNIKLVAVKVTNNSAHVINIGSNAAFFSGNTIVYPLDAISIRSKLRQSVPSHLWYLLLTPLTFSVNNSNPVPIGLILGPAISGGNMITAGSANKKFFNELMDYDIMHRDIRPGETVYGLVGFKNMDYTPLTIKLIR